MNETLNLAEELEQRLPDGWWAENDGAECAYAYAPEDEDLEGPSACPGSVTVERGRRGWYAELSRPAPGRGHHEPAATESGLDTAEEALDAAARLVEEAEGL